jgi:hypothetical protein
MDIATTITRTMGANGWRPEPTRNPSKVDARLSYARAGALLQLEHRPQRQELWLWVHSSDDKRCLGLPYGKKLEKVLAKVVSVQDTLSVESYLDEYSQLQKVCDAQIMAWEQFQTAADALSESYGVQLLFERPFALDGEALWRAVRAELPQARRLGDLQFAFGPGPEPQAAVTPLGAPDAEKLSASVQQTWNWREAGAAVEKARFAVLVTDLVAGGVERTERVRMLFGLLRAALRVYPPLAVHWAPTQRMVAPEAILECKPEQQLAFVLNVRYWSPEPNDHFMDTRGLDAFGIPDLECRYTDFDPGRMASALQTVAGYLWRDGDQFDEEGGEINGLTEEPWLVSHEISTVEPTRPVLKIRAGRHASDK